MTNEMELCTLIKNSLIASGETCYKIPDPSSSFAIASQRPFDLFGTWCSKPLYIEAKYLKTLEAFDLSKIQDHQIEALLSFKTKCPEAICWIALGVSVGRGDHRVYLFSDIQGIAQRRKDKKNILKKELLVKPFYKVQKGLVNFAGPISVPADSYEHIPAL